MCKTEGTDWEATAMMHIFLKLEAWKVLERVQELYERTSKATIQGCSDDLEEFLADLKMALDGEQE